MQRWRVGAGRSFGDGIAIVTGAGSGIGQALALGLARRGVAGLALLDIDEAGLEETRILLAEAAPLLLPNARTYVLDIATRSDIASIHDAVLRDFGRVSFLFNVAGIVGMGRLPFCGDGSSEARFDRCLAVNLHGLVDCTRAFLPLIVKEPWGCVVNVSSAAGLFGVSQMLDYATAKWAVRGFSEALMLQMRLEHPSVSVHVVFPGAVGTNIFTNVVKQDILEGAVGNAKYSPTELAFFEKLRKRLRLAPGAPLEEVLQRSAVEFKKRAPMTVGLAADSILEAVLRNQWRILIGNDAKVVDALYRLMPNAFYGELSSKRLQRLGENAPEARSILLGLLAAAAVASAGLLRSRL